MNKKSEMTKAIEKAICWNHGGKMEGMVSLSTSPLKNEFCMNRCKNADTICAHCFSMNLQSMRKELKEKLIRNTDLLCGSIIPVQDMPLLNVRYFRLESFGDLQNTIQVQNYVNLCKRNPHTTFALWTKNPFIIRNAMRDGLKKPSNLIVIYSSPMTNKQVDIDRMKAAFPFIDKVFTVYDKEHSANVEINCGARHCMSCLKCYKKRTTSVINEQLK